MKAKPLVWIAGFALVIGGVAWLRVRILSNQDAADFDEQMRLAKAAGIPTTYADYAAAIPPAEPNENAAPLYRKLRGMMTPLGDYTSVDVALQHEATPAHIAAAKKVLKSAKSILDIVDRAAVKPRCWFDRDWSLGEAVLFPEFGDMKSAAKLLAMRGLVKADEGDAAGAMTDVREVMSISKHLREEGTQIGALVADATYSIGLHELANLSLQFPSHNAYKLALASGLSDWPKPDLHREFRGDLLGVLSMIELCATQEGRTKLGLKEGDVPTGPNPLALLLSQPKSKIAIVKAERDAWAALDLPEDQMEKVRGDAEMRRNIALLAYPMAGRLYSEFSSGQDAGEPAVDRLKRWRCSRMMYTALLRALNGRSVGKSIDTSDLLSAFDGKPLTYAYDGKQVRISIDSEDASRPIRLVVPPDMPKR